MREIVSGLVMTSVLLLCGCAGTEPVMNSTGQEQLQSLHLYAADGAARFALYLACTSGSVNCVNVGNAFSDWAGAHGVSGSIVDPNDPAFTGTGSAKAAEHALPYRVAIDYRPTIVPGYAVNSYGQSGQSFPPTVGYSAVISVFEAATGKLLMRLPVRHQQSTDHGKTANPYVRSQVGDLLDSLGAAAKRS